MIASVKYINKQTDYKMYIHVLGIIRNILVIHKINYLALQKKSTCHSELNMGSSSGVDHHHVSCKHHVILFIVEWL